MSLGLTSVDKHRQVMPMERFEPSTLAGPVFETGAYTVPPHRPVAIMSPIISHRYEKVNSLVREPGGYDSHFCADPPIHQNVFPMQDMEVLHKWHTPVFSLRIGKSPQDML